MLDKVPAVRCLPACPLAGANMKLVVNAIMGSMMAAFAEGMSLADKASTVTSQALRSQPARQPGNQPASCSKLLPLLCIQLCFIEWCCRSHQWQAVTMAGWLLVKQAASQPDSQTQSTCQDCRNNTRLYCLIMQIVLPGNLPCLYCLHGRRWVFRSRTS